MKSAQIIAAGLALLAASSAQAINSSYAKQLERSGCTQLTEAQGCDITKTQAQNAKAGFVTNTSASAGTASNATPYAGNWVAKGTADATVATIRIDNKERVWVNGKRVKAKRSDGTLVFREGFIRYTIQGDRRLKGEDYWSDSDAKSKGPIVSE